MSKPSKLKIEMPKIRLDQRPNLREKVFFVIVVLGLLVLFVNTFWSPLSERIEKKRKELAQVNIQVESLQSLIDSTRQQLAMEQRIPAETVELDERTKQMLERKVVDRLSEIHQAVSALSSRRLARGVRVEDISIGEPVDFGGYESVPISLQLRGQFGAIQGYVSSVGRGVNRPVVVRKFVMNRGSAPGSVEMSLQLDLLIPKN